MTCQVSSMELNKNSVESEVKHQKIFIPLRVKPSSRFTFGPPLIRHICWSTPGLLENVAGVTGGLLSPPASQKRRGKSFAGWKDGKKKKSSPDPLHRITYTNPRSSPKIAAVGVMRRSNANEGKSESSSPQTSSTWRTSQIRHIRRLLSPHV